MSDLPDLRVSDDERDRAVTELREHAVAGRLTLEEFSDRVDQAYAARSRKELDLVQADLPAAPLAPPRARRFGLAVMGGFNWRGRLHLPERSTVVAVMGGANIDLRTAYIEAPVVTLTTWAIMGGVNVTLPPNVDARGRGVLPDGRPERPYENSAAPGRPRPDPGVLAHGRRQRSDGTQRTTAKPLVWTP